MDATILRFAIVFLSLTFSTGAKFETANFVVTAETSEIARRVGTAAEQYRLELAEFWLGRRLPNWSRPCRLRVKTGSLGAGGETKFQFIGGEVLNWDMYVQGTLERILDSVLPHEVNHTIFASHYRRPLPRWADEGAATLFEHRAEQVKQLSLLKQVIHSDREFIELPRLLQMKEYPRGYRPMLIMYAEGYALADFLVQQGGRRKYLKLLTDGERLGWTKAIAENYAHNGIAELQKNWKAWILAGMPRLRSSDVRLTAMSGLSEGFRPAILREYRQEQTIRLQSPDREKSNSLPRRAPSVQHDVKPPTRVADRRDSGKTGAPAGLFRGFPGDTRAHKQTAPISSRGYRDASFEAPEPRQRPKQSAAVHRPAAGRSSSGRSASQALIRDARHEPPADLERTALVGTGEDSDQRYNREHLPRERTMVSGSLPQWAGFPGQKELF